MTTISYGGDADTHFCVTSDYTVLCCNLSSCFRQGKFNSNPFNEMDGKLLGKIGASFNLLTLKHNEALYKDMAKLKMQHHELELQSRSSVTSYYI